jgi:inorganic pyrophosphatase
MDLNDIDCIIEIPKGSNIKYEFDKKKNKMRCDRILHTSMGYPGNYGYIPNTLSDDGDPIDVLLITDYKLNSNTLIRVKIIGILLMKDEAGIDEKLLCLPHANIDPTSEYVTDIEDLPRCLLDKILHFFKHYKDTEKNKFVEIIGFKDKEYAEKIFLKSIETYVKHNLKQRPRLSVFDMCGND